jgi:hypothetical protein
MKTTLEIPDAIFSSREVGGDRGRNRVAGVCDRSGDRCGDVALILDTIALLATADREPAALEVVASAERLAVPVIASGE